MIPCDNQATPALLRIPSELRNLIYSYALIEDDTIELLDFDANTYMEADLLWTCRQIREEAAPVFDEDNHFFNEVHHLKFGPQPNHWFGKKIPSCESCLEFSGPDLWSNLKAWLGVCYYEGESYGEEAFDVDFNFWYQSQPRHYQEGV